MAIKALKIILTLALGAVIFVHAGNLPSLRLALMTSMLLPAAAAFALILRLPERYKILATAIGGIFAIVGAFIAQATWSGIEVLSNLPLEEAVRTTIPSGLAFAFFVVGVVMLGMSVSDLVDKYQRRAVR